MVSAKSFIRAHAKYMMEIDRIEWQHDDNGKTAYGQTYLNIYIYICFIMNKRLDPNIINTNNIILEALIVLIKL